MPINTVLSLLSCLLLMPGLSHALTLQEGLRIVAGSGRDVKIALSNEEAARGGVWLARSPWLPQVNAYGNETWLRYEPTVRTPFGSFVTGQDRFLSYGITANQLLYDFGKTSSSIDAAKFAVRALATHLYYFASILGRARTDLLELEGGKQWVRELVEEQP